MRKILWTYCFFSFVLIANGQRVIQPKMIEFDWKGIVYKYEKSFEFKMYDGGWAIAYNNAQIKSYNHTKFYHFEIGHTKDPRERKQNNNSIITILNRSRSYIYGKQNVMLNARLGIGHKKYLSEKAKRRGIAVGYSYEIGPSIAIMKPYYLELAYNIETEFGPGVEIRNEKYSEENAEKFLNANGNDIFGAAGYFEGLDEIFLRLGAQGKFGAHFAMGAYDKYVKAVEAGLMVDVFPRKIPIMIENDSFKNRNVFLRLYLSVQLGWRKNA